MPTRATAFWLALLAGLYALHPAPAAAAGDASFAAQIGGTENTIGAQAGILRTTLESAKPIPHLPGNLALRVGIQRPAGKVIGDILYLHGFADRIDNHAPLFAAFTQAGFRVISFDLPEHGEDSGGLENNLNFYSFEKISELAVQVEKATEEDPARPLILAGWSTGGLIAVRMAQQGAFVGTGRSLSALILFAPGVAVRMLVGEFGIVTRKTLTSNPDPPHAGPIKPISPMLITPVFALRLLSQGHAARQEALPTRLPTLVFVGGDKEDHYADSPAVSRWVEAQRADGATIAGVRCPHAYHELDNEPAPVGAEVRATAASFARSAASGNFLLDTAALGSCAPF